MSTAMIIGLVSIPFVFIGLAAVKEIHEGLVIYRDERDPAKLIGSLIVACLFLVFYAWIFRELLDGVI